MTTGTQFTGTIAANATSSWFTFGWNPASHVVWYLMPTTVGPAAQLSLTVQVDRVNATQTTYWLVVKNLTGAPVTFEGRYAILN